MANGGLVGCQSPRRTDNSGTERGRLKLLIAFPKILLTVIGAHTQASFPAAAIFWNPEVMQQQKQLRIGSVMHMLSRRVGMGARPGRNEHTYVISKTSGRGAG